MSTRRYKNGLAKVGRYWWICFKRGKQKVELSTGCTNRADAEFVLAEEKRKKGFQRLGIKLPESIKAPQVGDVVREWATCNRGVLSDRYLDQALESLDRHWAPISKDPMNEVTTEKVDKLRASYISGKGFKTLKGHRIEIPHTLGGWNRQVRLLSAVFGWAIRDRKYISSRPWHARERKVQQTGRPVVWPEQVQSYLAAVDSHSRKAVIRLGIRMQLGLGLRESEAGGARWEWLSWRQEEYLPGDTKNRKTRRIPIPAWLLQLLLVEWNRQGCPTHGLVLPDAKEEQKARGFTKNAIREAGEDIGVPGLHPHRMRATFATTHYEAGTPLSEIQQMMGHEKPATTLRYIEMRQVRAAEAQAKVAAAMGFAPGSPSTQEAS